MQNNNRKDCTNHQPQASVSAETWKGTSQSNNVTSAHRHLITVQPLFRRQCHATRQQRNHDQMACCAGSNTGTREHFGTQPQLFPTPHRRPRDMRTTTTVTSDTNCHLPDVNATRLSKVHTICDTHTASTSVNNRTTLHAPTFLNATIHQRRATPTHL